MDYQAIRDANVRRLQNAGIPVHPHLPLLDECPRRSAEEVARRVVVLYCLAGVANGASGPAILEWVADAGLEPFFQPAELAVLAARDFSDEELNELSWCQEALYAVAWALSLVGELGWPDQEADLESVFPRIPPEVDVASFVERARLRSEGELVEAADLYYCLDASLRHDELWNGEPAESRYPVVQIVMERRRALDWIMQDCAWSDISLDT